MRDNVILALLVSTFSLDPGILIAQDLSGRSLDVEQDKIHAICTPLPLSVCPVVDTPSRPLDIRQILASFLLNLASLYQSMSPNLFFAPYRFD